jgi:hypothetical protein
MKSLATKSLSWLLLLAACGDDDVTPMDATVDAPAIDAPAIDAPPTMQPTFDVEHVYSRVTPPHETAEACRTANPDETFECVQSLVLCPNGDFTLRLTEVVNAGGYALRPGNVVQALRRGSGDGPERFSGVADDDAGTFASETPELEGVWTRVTMGAAACL